MNSMYDVLQLLKKYGTFIYTKDKNVDIDLMEEEIRELYQAEMLDTKSYQQAILILRQEKQKLV